MKTDDYASKPLLPEELMKKIKGLLERAKEEARNRGNACD
jgi:DNA-binding response OmpR family regulator